MSEDDDASTVYYNMRIEIALKKGIIPHSNHSVYTFVNDLKIKFPTYFSNKFKAIYKCSAAILFKFNNPQ